MLVESVLQPLLVHDEQVVRERIKRAAATEAAQKEAAAAALRRRAAAAKDAARAKDAAAQARRRQEAKERPAPHAHQPSASACVTCTDEPSDNMKSEKISCQAALHALPGSERRKKCAYPSGDLVHAGFCKRSCSTFSASAVAAGALQYNGWGSVQCCEERVR